MKTYGLGVDVSSFNPNSVASYAKLGATFVLAKLSEGTWYKNTKAATQIISAKKNKMQVHGYHFANFGANTYQAKVEANYAIAAAKKFGLPLGAYLACDWETGDGNNVGAGKDVSARAILVFMDTVKAAGYQPLLYSGASLLRWNIDTAQILKKYPNCLWVASYATMGRIDTPNFNYFPSMDGVLIWQFTQNWHGVKVDANIAVLPLKQTVTSIESDDIMNWNIKTEIDDAGGFMVTKKAGATLWTGPNNDKKVGKMLKYGTNWRVVDVKDGFYKVGTDQWVDARCGVFKMNPLRYQSIHAVVEVVGAAAGHAKPTAEVTGRTFKIGERLTISGRENHYLKIKGGSGKNAYVNGRKVKVIL